MYASNPRTLVTLAFSTGWPRSPQCPGAHPELLLAHTQKWGDGKQEVDDTAVLSVFITSTRRWL